MAKDCVVQLATAAGRAESEIETGLKALCSAAGGLHLVKLTNVGTSDGKQFVCATVGQPSRLNQPHLNDERIKRALEEKAAAYGFAFIGFVH